MEGGGGDDGGSLDVSHQFVDLARLTALRVSLQARLSCSGQGDATLGGVMVSMKTLGVEEDTAAQASEHKTPASGICPLTSISLKQSVFNDPVATADQLMEQAQLLLHDHRHSLRVLDFSGSNVTGRIFFQGRAFVCQDPLKERVTVENMDTLGQPVVRDDDPPRDFVKDGVHYCYVKTAFNERNFLRYYVALDWLHNVSAISMAHCTLSGYGLTSLCAATASSLHHLSLSSCPDVDDRGLFAVARLCKALVHLDIANCPQVTSYGVLFLGQLGAAQVEQLEYVNVSNTVSHRVVKALLTVLEMKRFSGIIVFNDVTMSARQRLVPPALWNPCGTITYSSLHQRFTAYPDRITDLSLQDISLRCVKPSVQQPTLVRMELADELINDEVLLQILLLWGSRLYSLVLSGTYITETGLAYLTRCPNLRELGIARCQCITDKQLANRSILDAINGMLRLSILDISDTRVSGRMLSQHPSLRLSTLMGARSPMSVHAVRTLTETCHRSMHHLNLAGCRFINSKCMHYLLRFSQLQTLDISFCEGLRADDVLILSNYPASFLQRLERIHVSGVRGMNSYLAQTLSQTLTQKKNGQTPVLVVWNGDAARNSAPASLDDAKANNSALAGESLLESCPYAPLKLPVEPPRVVPAPPVPSQSCQKSAESEHKSLDEPPVNSQIMYTAHALAYQFLVDEDPAAEAEDSKSHAHSDGSIYSPLRHTDMVRAESAPAPHHMTTTTMTTTPPPLPLPSSCSSSSGHRQQHFYAFHSPDALMDAPAAPPAPAHQQQEHDEDDMPS